MRLKLPGAPSREELRRLPDQPLCLRLHRLAPVSIAPAAEARAVRRQLEKLLVLAGYPSGLAPSRLTPQVRVPVAELDWSYPIWRHKCPPTSPSFGTPSRGSQMRRMAPLDSTRLRRPTAAPVVNSKRST